MRAIGVTVALLASGWIAACGSSSTDVSQPPGRQLPANGIDIVPGAQSSGTKAFTPNPLTVSLAAGGVVQWFNDDQTTGAYGGSGVTHNITADDASFSSGNLAPGASFQTTLPAQGSFPYHCAIHPTMRGTVNVGP